MMYKCITCDFSTVILTNYNKHLLTKKHKRKSISLSKSSKTGTTWNNINVKNNTNLVANNIKDKKSELVDKELIKNQCEYCYAKYAQSSGLYKHLKKCEEKKQPRNRRMFVNQVHGFLSS